MSSKRYNKRIDKAQPAIVEALRKAGRYVKIMNDDLDLLVGYNGKTYILEVKDPSVISPKTGKVIPSALKDSQKKFFAEWPGGPAFIVSTPEEALVVTHY